MSVGRDVALKLLHFGPMAGEETIKRLRMEAMAAGSLRHPNIVAIHEVGIHEDQDYPMHFEDVTPSWVIRGSRPGP